MKELGIAGWITIILVIAKLAGFIAWSWWWVFSPLWISFVLCIILLLILAIVALIVP